MSLEKQVERLKTENLKLTTDVKIIRNEHSEILHKIVGLDRKNALLLQENEGLRRMLGGGALAEEESQERRRGSPFQSFLERDRSLS